MVLSSKEADEPPHIGRDHGMRYLTLVMLVTIAFLGGTVSSEAAQPTAQVTNPYTSAEVCGNCHRDIYERWRQSLHANSFKDPIFYTSYMEAYTTSGGKAKFFCLKCHAPTTQVTQDYEARLPVTKEGVTCDFCHTVKAVYPDRPDNPFELEPGIVKRGPKRGRAAAGHETEYSPLHKTSVLCAGCHEYQAASGVVLFGTYSEWKNGPYPKEETECQNCHMPRRQGHPVGLPGNADEDAFVNEHNLAGGHSVEQVRKAVELNIESVERTADQLLATILVTNRGSGHMIPTGLPSRKIVLTVKAVTSGGNVHIDSVKFQKILADRDGKELDKDSDILLRGVSVAFDNRIAPQETRRLKFNFRIPKEVPAKVMAEITYLYEPMLLKQESMSIPMNQAEWPMDGGR